MAICRTVLKVADEPNAQGDTISRDALCKLTEKFPEKLQMIGNELISRVEFVDDVHKQRMLSSITFQLDQQKKDEKRKWCREVLSPKCTARTVEETDSGYKLFVWHPQWGGYTSHAEVEFSKTTGDSDSGPGCFELAVYHNGDFPTDEPAFHRHCCSAEHFVRFGLNVLEAQLLHQQNDKGNLVRMGDTTKLETFRDRLTTIIDKEANQR